MTTNSFGGRSPFAPQFLWLLSVLVCGAAGCTRYSYTVELHPVADKKVTRSIHFQPNERKFRTEDDPEIRRLAASYSAEVPIGAERAVSFASTFADTMPQDVGGAGRYSQWDSPLGSVRVYAERFRGNDDLDTMLRVRRQAVDQLADLIVGWFESEIRDDPQWPTLRAFLDHPFRNDLQNISLLALAFNGAWDREKPNERESVEVEISLRAVHYLVERGYLTYDQSPAMWRAIENMINREKFSGILSQLRAMVVRRMGERGTIDQSSGPRFLLNAKNVSTSWERYFTKSDYFLQQLEDFDARHQKELQNAPDRRAEVRVQGMTIELLEAALSPWGDSELAGDHDNLHLTLSVEHPPCWTNGEWISESQHIEWSRNLPTTDKHPALTSWPAFCYAIWAEPNHQAQTQLFGKASLIDMKLFDYTLWYAGLTDQEQQEWDAFAGTLRPDQEWTAQLSKFRFSDEPEGIEPDDRRASSAINLLKVARDTATSNQAK